MCFGFGLDEGNYLICIIYLFKLLFLWINIFNIIKTRLLTKNGEFIDVAFGQRRSSFEYDNAGFSEIIQNLA